MCRMALAALEFGLITEINSKTVTLHHLGDRPAATHQFFQSKLGHLLLWKFFSSTRWDFCLFAVPPVQAGSSASSAVPSVQAGSSASSAVPPVHAGTSASTTVPPVQSEFSPETVRPHPRAGPRKITKANGREKCKSAILTDTPRKGDFGEEESKS